MGFENDAFTHKKYSKENTHRILKFDFSLPLVTVCYHEDQYTKNNVFFGSRRVVYF